MGIYTGSVYHDGGLYQKGNKFKGEMENWEDKTTIVVKIHRYLSSKISREMINSSKNCIFLMREPKAAFKSEYTRFKSKSHTGEVSSEIFTQPEWTNKINKWVSAYTDAYMVPFKRGCKHGIHYMFMEDLLVELEIV